MTTPKSTDANLAAPTVWPESEDHEWGGCRPAPAEFALDMLATLARVFHEVYELRERLQALPDWQSIEPVGGIIECLMQDAKLAIISAIRTAHGKPTDQQACFSSTEDAKPTSATVNEWRFDVEPEISHKTADTVRYRWSLSATKVD